jgi:hypothetical protein
MRSATGPLIISVDASCSGRRAACAAVATIADRVIATRSRFLADIDGYALAAEIAAVAIGAGLAATLPAGGEIVVEIDNLLVRRVLLEGYFPPQAGRIPDHFLESAQRFANLAEVSFRLLKRNSSPGLRRADALARDRLWRHRRRRQAQGFRRP